MKSSDTAAHKPEQIAVKTQTLNYLYVQSSIMGTKNSPTGTESLTEQRRRLHGEFGMMSTAINGKQLEATVKQRTWPRFEEFVEDKLSLEIVEESYMGSGNTRVKLE